jgi:predicted deacylase
LLSAVADRLEAAGVAVEAVGCDIDPTAVAADRPGSPLDHHDLNRYFPGHADGSHTERLGAALTTVTEGADALVFTTWA